MITLHSIINDRTALHRVVIILLHELRDLHPPPHFVPQELQSVQVLDFPSGGGGEDEAADGGEEETGLYARVQEVEGVHVCKDLRRNDVVDGLEGGDSGEVFGAGDPSMEIDD